MRTVLRLFGEVAQLAPYIPAPFAVAAMNITEPGDLADFLAANLNLDAATKQRLLEELDIDKRLQALEAAPRRPSSSCCASRRRRNRRSPTTCARCSASSSCAASST